MENKTVRQFKKGSLEMVLLCLIAQRETYGYELLTTLNDKAGSVLAGPGRVRSTPFSTASRSRACCRPAWPPPPPTEA